MRWSGQELGEEQRDALPGLARLNNLVRSVRTPEFAGIAFHEVLAKSALNKVPGSGSSSGSGALPFGWTINPYRGCSHSCVYCFARPTHTYLGFDAGRDFDNEIVVKVNVAEVLGRELARPSWERHPVALGTNTDPYQRAEGRYALMPGIITALTDSGTPFSILTKGSLLRRDLDQIADAAARVPVSLALSIAVYDEELQRSIEPGTPSTAARLATVTAVREHGLDCSVFLMPILPYLTDSKAHLDEALHRVEEAGASSVLYASMYLKPGVKEWFMSWLKCEHPELVKQYTQMYAGGAYPPTEYRKWLSARIRPLIARHGLRRGQEDPVTGGARQGRAGRPRFVAARTEATATATALTLF